MLSENNIALKEWAVVVKALEEGRQCLILRKGGIREERGEFTVDHREFFLFPTYTHQMYQGIIPEADDDLRAVETSGPPDGCLVISNYAVVEDAIRVEEWARMAALQGLHIWSPNTIKGRFFWGQDKGIHVLLLRVFRLSRALSLPMREHYGGCKSWVELEEKIPTAGSHPVLSPEAFSLQIDKVRASLLSP